MRLPPTDIFVWGMHPDTVPDNIVMNLTESGIEIEQKDVIKKSRDGSALLSLKVSVKAEDLQKTHSPDVWPLCVKVREYIYYPKKKSTKKSNDERNSAQHPNPQSQSSGSNSASTTTKEVPSQMSEWC